MSARTLVCSVSKRNVSIREIIEGKNLRPHLLALIKADHSEFNEESLISVKELNKYRRKYLENVLTDEADELSKMEQEVIHSISENEILSENIESDLEKDTSFADRLSDAVADFVGSWTFIIAFFAFCAIWMVINLIALFGTFDPYPFILLNLSLSCLAAIQAPFIMMSQNRKEVKDRKRSEHDYKVNLKAELEIRLLHEKIDHLLVQQNKRFIEIQQIQMDVMEDILNSRKSR